MRAAPLPLRQVALEDGREEKKPIVPECADVAVVRRRADDASPVFDLETEGARPDLQEPMTKSDQPTRAPAFDFQGSELSVPSSFQR